VLEFAVSVMAKRFETRIADLVRMFGTEHEGEALNVWTTLKRLLASQDVSFTDLGGAIERLATGDLRQDEMKRLFDAGYAKGLADARRDQEEAQAVFGLRPDGSPDWERIALHCQREQARIDAKHHEFINDMAGRLVWGREPTERQGKYLLSLFRGLGGRI
jgi:hypothetical protein